MDKGYAVMGVCVYVCVTVNQIQTLTNKHWLCSWKNIILSQIPLKYCMGKSSYCKKNQGLCDNNMFVISSLSH